MTLRLPPGTDSPLLPFLTTALLGASVLLPVLVALPAAAALLLVGLLAARRWAPPSVEAAVVVALLMLSHRIDALAALWPLPLIVALALGYVLSWVRGVTPTFAWVRAGRLSPGIAIGILGVVAASSFALVVWYRLVRPDASTLPPLPALGPAALAAALAAWAMANAAAEEALYRGALQTALGHFMPPAGAILLQGVAFGLLHVRGFPSGPSGVVLASVYGTMLGALRARAGGLAAPWIAHVAADLTILGIRIWLIP